MRAECAHYLYYINTASEEAEKFLFIPKRILRELLRKQIIRLHLPNNGTFTINAETVKQYMFVFDINVVGAL